MRSNRLSVLVVAALGLLAFAPAARATFPGENGLIAFGSNGDYLGTNADGDFEIFTMTPEGAVLAQLTNNVGATDNNADWSADGSRIAFRSRRDGNHEIYVMDADGQNQKRLTSHPAVDDAPSWSADGSRIYFQSNRTGVIRLYVMKADGSDLRRVTDSEQPEGRVVESPDGRTLAFVRVNGTLASGPFAVYTMSVDGSNVP